ncbi:MAG: Fic family protein [Candidatus Daviesbacteria bacterium]|nr:Fic family protein [Candidatus Daviesbacteria bacterium]
MNDTNINSRQKRILEIISQSEGISRFEIKNSLENTFSGSVPTISRDLSFLLKKGTVHVDGKGRNTRYFPINSNPLLKYIDIDQYFIKEPDQRVETKKNFDFTILEKLQPLFTSEEIEEINKVNKSFSNESKTLSKDIYLKELERFTIELSWKSSKIEGNTYSLLDTETLIKQGVPSPGHPKEEAIMILNHKQAFESILENISDFSVISISKISQMHNFLIKNLSISTGIRHQAVGITGTVYQPLDNEWQIKEALEKYIFVLNKTKFPLEKALITLAMISYIQPFADGNKRTARMLSNAILLASDFYPLSYRSVEETTYKKALILFYEQGSLYQLKKIVIDQYKFALNTYFK